jgi:hypothetical protein
MDNTKFEEINYAKNQAESQLDFILKLVDALRKESGVEEALNKIYEHPLCVQVRTGWHEPGKIDPVPEEYELLLCTGGPAVRIIGELTDGEPSSAEIQYQDWGTPWTRLWADSIQEQDILIFASQFTYDNE